MTNSNQFTNPWLNKEIEYLKINYPKGNIINISNKLGRSINAIKLKANRLKLKKQIKSNEWSQSEIKILRKEYHHGDINKLCKKIGKSKMALQTKTHRLGIKRNVQINLDKKNGMWKGGITQHYYQRLARDNFKKICSNCGSKINLEIHHLVIFCRKCHREEHKRQNYSKNKTIQ